MRIRVALFATVLLAACGGISFENQDAVEGMYPLAPCRASRFRSHSTIGRCSSPSRVER